MKFVFNQDPTSVQRKLSQFTNDLEGAFAQPLKFNIYDTEFYSQVDGSIDFGRTSSCFQIMSDDHVVDLETSKSIFNNNESDLKDLYDAYNIVQVEVRLKKDIVCTKGQKSTFYPKITFVKSQFWLESQFQKVAFLTKFTILKSQL